MSCPSLPQPHNTTPRRTLACLFPRRSICTIGIACAIGLTGTAAAASGLPTLQRLAHKGASVSALVVDLDNNKTLASMNPSLRLTPASLTKLVTAAAAFDHWHADHAFTTRLLVNGDVKDGRIDGDLILQGGGDASLDEVDLWSLVGQLKGAGITAIDGSLLVVHAPFGSIKCATPDRCKALKSSDTAYNAEVSSIGIDFGTWCVAVRPQAPGEPAQVGSCTMAQLPIPVNGNIETVPAGRSPSYWVERRTSKDGDRLQVHGEIPAGRTAHIYRAMSNPARGAGLVLAEMLREIGIHFSGKVIVTSDLAAANTYTIASVTGKTLREQLDAMLRYSNNYIADVITMDLASTGPGATPPATLAEAGKSLSAFIAYNNSRGQGSAPPAPPIDSGSGLTPSNRLSARDLINLLTNMYHNPRTFPAFYGGLVVPREAPFAFLRRGSRAWLDRVALKTGTMNDPHSVFGIAGYMRKKHGGWMAFAIIVNGNSHHHHVPLYKSLAAARGDVEAILAHH